MKLNLKSGDFLEDIDIEVYIRSGKTDFKVLTNLEQVIVTSVIEIVDSDVVLTETLHSIHVKGPNKLTIIKNVFKV
jgi:hypothetical protein